MRPRLDSTRCHLGLVASLGLNQQYERRIRLNACTLTCTRTGTVYGRHISSRYFCVQSTSKLGIFQCYLLRFALHPSPHIASDSNFPWTSLDECTSTLPISICVVMSHADRREIMPQPIQIVLLDAHAGDKRERRMLSHVIGKFVLRCFSCTYAAHYARLIVLVVDSRENTQPHLSLLVDHIALRDSRALPTALRRLSLALKTSMKDANYSNATTDESDACTMGYANLLLGAAADFIPSISNAGTLAKSLCISTSDSSGSEANVHVLTTEKIASVLSSLRVTRGSTIMPSEVINKSFAHVNAIPYSSLSEEMLAHLLDDILGQSMRLHAQLVLPTSPDGAPSGNVSLPLTLQPRLLITDSVAAAPVQGVTSSMSSLGMGLSAGTTMAGAVPTRHASDPSRIKSPSEDRQAYSALSFTTASSVPSVKKHDSASHLGLMSAPPQTIHVLHSAPRLSVPQDVLYGLPFIGWGGTVTLAARSSNSGHVGSVPTHSANSPGSPYGIDSRTDAVLSTLSDSERVLLCVSFDKDKMANCSYAILPSQQRSRPTMALVVQIAHIHTFLPMPSALLHCIHTQHTGATSVAANESVGLNTYSNNSGIEQSGSEELKKDGTVIAPNFAENNGVENVISVLNNVPFRPFSPLDLSTLTSTSRPTNDQSGTAHERRVRFDDNVCVI